MGAKKERNYYKIRSNSAITFARKCVRLLLEFISIGHWDIIPA